MAIPDIICSAEDYFVSFSPPGGFSSRVCGTFTARGARVSAEISKLVPIPGARNEDLFLEYADGSLLRFRAYSVDHGGRPAEEAHDHLICGRRARTVCARSTVGNETISGSRTFVEFAGPGGPWVLGFVYGGAEPNQAVDDELIRAVASLHTEPTSRAPSAAALTRYWFRCVGVDLPSAWQIDLIAHYKGNFAGALGSLERYGCNANIVLDTPFGSQEASEQFESTESKFIENLAKWGRTGSPVRSPVAVAGADFSHLFAVAVDANEFPASVEDLGDGLETIPDPRNKAGFVRYQGLLRIGADIHIRVCVEAEARVIEFLPTWWMQTIRSLSARGLEP